MGRYFLFGEGSAIDSMRTWEAEVPLTEADLAVREGAEGMIGLVAVRNNAAAVDDVIRASGV